MDWTGLPKQTCEMVIGGYIIIIAVIIYIHYNFFYVCGHESLDLELS